MLPNAPAMSTHSDSRRKGERTNNAQATVAKNMTKANTMPSRASVLNTTLDSTLLQKTNHIRISRLT